MELRHEEFNGVSLRLSHKKKKKGCKKKICEFMQKRKENFASYEIKGRYFDATCLTLNCAI